MAEPDNVLGLRNGLAEPPRQGWLYEGARTAARHAGSYFGLADYLLGRMPSTAAGLLNSAIPYQPFGGVPEAHAASQGALDDFRSLYPSTSKLALELSSNPFGPGGANAIFLGMMGARNLEKIGRPTGRQALEMAERMEAQGASPAEIRAATNRLIERGDPALGGVSKGRDGRWRLEASDEGMQVRMGTGWDRVSHPEFEAAYPGHRIQAAVSEAPLAEGGLLPVHPDFNMTVRGPTEAARRQGGAHEYTHIPQILEGFAQGGDYRQIGPSLRPIGRNTLDNPTLQAGRVVQLGGEEPWQIVEARRLLEREPPGPRRDAMVSAMPRLSQEAESSRAFDFYNRLAGEAEAESSARRLNLTAAQRRDRLPELDEGMPRSRQILWHD